MNLVDRVGTFRGKPLDWGVSETKNGFPQFVMRVQALEYYDEEKGEYVSWAEYEQEITGYFVLFTKDKNDQWTELLNAKQLKKVFGWTGADFESLANGQYGETIVLFRVEENEFNGNTSLKLVWLDTADANPVKTLPKFDTAKLKVLTAKLGGALQGSAPTPATPKPASAKPAAPPRGKPGPKPRGTPASAPTHAPAAPSPTAPSAAPTPPASAPTTPETKASAWTAVNEMKAKDITDEKLAEVWVQVASTVGKTEDKFTSEDWATVRKNVLEQVAIF